MRRLLALAALAAAVALPAAPPAMALRQCGGVVDLDCTGWVCPTDCWYRDCAVWIDVRHNPMTAVCVQQVAPAA